MFSKTSYIEAFLLTAGGQGGVRGYRNRGDSKGEAGKRNVVFVGEGVREWRNVGAVGENVAAVGESAWSKIDNGEQGSRGAAVGKSVYGQNAGGLRKGFVGDFGDMTLNGEGVSGFQ
jgi:hypothetical protein